jgi:CheY-like chemotaxis protein
MTSRKQTEDDLRRTDKLLEDSVVPTLSGSNVRLYLPASPSNHGGAVSPRGSEVPLGKRILLMDDEEMLSVSIKRLFKLMGHEVDGARNCEEVIQSYLEAYQEERPFDLVVLDLTVKEDMGGKETLAILRKIDPHVKTVISNGHSNEPIIED